ncbi:uncharacterized protein GGS22DRAFT_150517 [Annulohypoxylon maeteangense]|uniref:uncharacterized protein n=1 Tax=Annulohypoxylon maeteangense TaxID=1927788 RepID=UPI002007DE17|nr:uncharacterized protein GGS22DRAFT_150517 [Annulohypoxylon maeteangense]KAI0890301.1 hypothetical protein GGS22DRAFT_150517 [Annulohypoxylon maeteangense]
MDPLHHRTPKTNRRSCCYDLKSKDGWFKGPRDTAWTIDSTVNGKSNPSGYDSNTLITILRWSQFFTSAMTLILYVFTLSAPVLWLLLLAGIAGFLSCLFSILALYLRHRWTIWLVIPEILLTIAWIVLFATSSLSSPPDSKGETFQLGLIAIEASMVLWIQTFLLAITPAFHKMLPRLFGVKNSGVIEPHGSMDRSEERVRWSLTLGDEKLTGSKQPSWAANAAPIPANTNIYSSSATPSIACPQPTRRGPALSDIELQDYLAAQGAGNSTSAPRTLTTPHRSATHSTPYAGSIERTDSHLRRKPIASGGLPPLETSRGVSPVSMDYIGPLEPVSPLSNIDPWSTSTVRGGDARSGF